MSKTLRHSLSDEKSSKEAKAKCKHRELLRVWLCLNVSSIAFLLPPYTRFQDTTSIVKLTHVLLRIDNLAS